MTFYFVASTLPRVIPFFPNSSTFLFLLSCHPCDLITSKSILAVPTFLSLIIYFIYVIVKAITIQGEIHAFQATILLLLFFSGINIMLFGIIGEYLGRIFNESKHRPLYLVDEYNDERETNENL